MPDTIGFLNHIAPVLEQRLDNSGAHRYTGELRIGFYDLTGIALKFENGHLAAVEPTHGKDGYDIQFPWHTFWNVVFGHHTPEELFVVLPETYANAKASVLLATLFPKKRSWLQGLS